MQHSTAQHRTAEHSGTHSNTQHGSSQSAAVCELFCCLPAAAIRRLCSDNINHRHPQHTHIHTHIHRHVPALHCRHSLEGVGVAPGGLCCPRHEPVRVVLVGVTKLAAPLQERNAAAAAAAADTCANWNETVPHGFCLLGSPNLPPHCRE
jgi:hypothetical protein